jgi:TPR repeat protein
MHLHSECSGNCFEVGNGVQKDVAAAVGWYEKAAGNKDAQAQFELGWHYSSIMKGRVFHATLGQPWSFSGKQPSKATQGHAFFLA